MAEDKALTTTVIKPQGSIFNFELKDIWTYRELLYFLVWRDIKIRYKQTAIGVLWVVLQPVLTTALFAVIFSQVGRFDSAGIPYILYVLSGLMLWLFVFNGVAFASNSLLVNVNLITKTFFPRLILPFAAVFASIIDILIAFLLLLAVMAFYGVRFSSGMLLAPVFMVLTVLLTLSLGSFFAAVNVRFRDVKFGLPFFLQIWMFASPIFYPADIVPEKVRTILLLNPMVGILQGFRASLFGTPVDWNVVGPACAVVVGVTVISLWVFKKMEDSFADLI